MHRLCLRLSALGPVGPANCVMLGCVVQHEDADGMLVLRTAPIFKLRKTARTASAAVRSLLGLRSLTDKCWRAQAPVQEQLGK